MFELNQTLFDSLQQQLTREYLRILEDAIYHAIDSHYCDEFPTMDYIREHGRIVHCRQGDDIYDEFQWEGKPQFRQRIVFSGKDSLGESRKVEIRIDWHWKNAT